MALDPDFTRILNGAIRAQASKPFNPNHCTAVISQLLIDHPSTLERLPLAQARTIGNQ
jgi:hypothetical protein